jgi:hypothetical protein
MDNFCSVRDDHCCCSVHNGEGSRTSVDHKFDHMRLRTAPTGPSPHSESQPSPVASTVPSRATRRTAHGAVAHAQAGWGTRMGDAAYPTMPLRLHRWALHRGSDGCLARTSGACEKKPRDTADMKTMRRRGLNAESSPCPSLSLLWRAASQYLRRIRTIECACTNERRNQMASLRMQNKMRANKLGRHKDAQEKSNRSCPCLVHQR